MYNFQSYDQKRIAKTVNINNTSQQPLKKESLRGNSDCILVCFLNHQCSTCISVISIATNQICTIMPLFSTPSQAVQTIPYTQFCPDIQLNSSSFSSVNLKNIEHYQEKNYKQNYQFMCNAVAYEEKMKRRQETRYLLMCHAYSFYTKKFSSNVNVQNIKIRLINILKHLRGLCMSKSLIIFRITQTLAEILISILFKPFSYTNKIESLCNLYL